MRETFFTYREPTLPKAWDALIVVATLVSLGVVALELNPDLDVRLSQHLDQADLALCGIFLLDFVLRAIRASRFRTFLRRNWIDLLAAIPMVDAFRAGRLVRVLRLLRLMKVDFIKTHIHERYGLQLPSEMLSGLGLVAVLTWLLTATLFFLFEHGPNEAVTGFGDALWWSMTTLSTVGYGDLYPASLGGRIVAVITMVLGVGVLGTLAASLASFLIEAKDRGKRGLRSYRMQGHLLVLGWNEKAPAALREFQADPRYHNTPIVVVANQERLPVDMPNVSFVRGEPMQPAVLRRASAEKAAAAILFSSAPTDPRSDHEAALTVLSLRRLHPHIHISAELVDADNEEHLLAAGCHETVQGNALTAALLVASVQDRGVGELVRYLLTSERGSELHRIPVPERLVGQAYRNFAVEMAAQSRPILGLARGKEMLVNPDPTTELLAGDEAFIAAPTY